MEKEIEIIFLKEAEKYFNNLPPKVKDKFTISFTKTKLGYKGEWFEKVKNSDGVFEFRARDAHKFYRIFAFWDGTSKNKTLVVGTHGLDKKSNKTPAKEIKKSEQIKKSISIQYKDYERNNIRSIEREKLWSRRNAKKRCP